MGTLIEKGYLCPSELSGRDVGRCINQLLAQEGLTGYEAAVRLVEIIRKKVAIHIIKEDWAKRMFEELPADCVKEAIPIIEDELEVENKISAISAIEGAKYGIEGGNLKAILSAIKDSHH